MGKSIGNVKQDAHLNKTLLKSSLLSSLFFAKLLTSFKPYRPGHTMTTNSDIKQELTENYKNIITHIGEDINREGLQKTPERAAKAMQYLTRGYEQDLATVINGALFESQMDEMVLVKDIELYSLCEHHLLPFIGKAHVAYIPNGKVLGLSKVARIVDMFARRLQIQEGLTQQIADTLLAITEAKGVAVVIEAEHLCMRMRGVQKQNSVMKTSIMKGIFRDNERTRAEFFSLIS